MERVRENMSEFKGCAKWGQQLRWSLNGVNHLCSGYYFGNIMKVARGLQLQDDVHDRGKRSILLSSAPQQLTTVVLNTRHSFDEVLTHPFKITFSEDRRTVTLRLEGFRSFFGIVWPDKFFSYRLGLTIAQVADFVWDETPKELWAAWPGLERCSVTVFTEWKNRSADPEDLVLSASFKEPVALQPGVTVVAAVGVELCVASGEAGYGGSAGCGTVKIGACFT
ncbi:MAG: hypothetical protein Q8908_15325, partial [Bacteroidota bacterium]|nr:hypothetical protein [Bacteroidota bacterium]